MDEFNTNLYKIHRREDGSLVRIDGLGGESPEMTVDYYDSQIAFHTQVLANLEAQRAKVAEYEYQNPAPVIEEADQEGDSVKDQL